MRIRFLMLLLLPALVACESDPLAGSSASYFPLEPGDYWTYRSGSGQYSERVSGTVDIDGRTYRSVISERDGAGLPADTQHVRNENGRFYQWDDGGEFLWVDFDAPIGQRWRVSESVEGWIERQDAVFTTPAGTFTNCVVVSYNYPTPGGSPAGYVYAPGVGLVATLNFYVRTELVSARVGGVDYPR